MRRTPCRRPRRLAAARTAPATSCSPSWPSRRSSRPITVASPNSWPTSANCGRNPGRPKSRTTPRSATPPAGRQKREVICLLGAATSAADRGLIGDKPTAAVDGMGLESRHTSRYLFKRAGRKRTYRLWPNVTVACDTESHVFAGAMVTTARPMTPLSSARSWPWRPGPSARTGFSPTPRQIPRPTTGTTGTTSACGPL